MNKFRKGQIVSYNQSGGWYGKVTPQGIRIGDDLLSGHGIYPGKIVEVNNKTNTVKFDHAFFDSTDMETPWVNDTRTIDVDDVYPIDFFNVGVIRRAITETLRVEGKLPRTKKEVIALFMKEYRKLHQQAVKARKEYEEKEKYSFDEDRDFVIQKIKELKNDQRGALIVSSIRFNFEIEEKMTLTNPPCHL